MARQTRPTPIWSVLLCSASLLMAAPAFAQVEITDDRTEPVDTATEGEGGTPADVTITSSGSVILENEGPAVILNSDNNLTNAGEVRITDVDNATGVSLEGGANRNFTNSGRIQVDEIYDPTDTDDDPFLDTSIATGSGRTGILISGSSPFQGNVTLEQTSNVIVEGNNSFGIDLSNTPLGAGLDGDLNLDGRIAIRGDNSAAVRTRSDITGNVTSLGAMDVVGVGSGAFDIGADIGGGFTSSGSLTSNGFRFTNRPSFNPDSTIGRQELDAEDLGQSGSTIAIRGNVGRGINLTEETETQQNADGEDVEVVVSRSNIGQTGSAPAILIDGDGNPIMIGTVSTITDPNADGYDEQELFAFVNRGSILSAGTYDDFDATAISVSDATLSGGMNNTGTIRTTTFVGGTERPIPGVDLGTGHARVIVLGDNALAERLNNSGIILALASEATDEVYFDPDNIPTPRPVVATAVDIGENASLESLINEGALQANIVGRLGTATVVNDASGTLSNVINRGNLSANAANSDPNSREETNFTLVALNLSNNTSGVNFLQELREDDDTTDDIEPNAPLLRGDVLLGSGDDNFVSTAGAINGDISFGAGDDRLALTDTVYSGAITNEDGLIIEVADADLTLTNDSPLAITSASFTGDSSFNPLVDGASGEAATLQATGAISFGNGTRIAPIFRNLINSNVIGGAAPSFALASGSNVTVADLASLNASEDGSFLFDTSYGLENDTLFITVDLRNSAELGLDPTQTGVGESVYGATLQALEANTALGNEIANLSTASEFYAAYNQLLPEFAAAGRQFVIANSDGAIGAVANHLDSVRRSQEKPGGAWIQAFAYFADRDLAGLSEQYRGEGFGFTGGLDTALGPFHAVGFNLGFASTEIEDVVGVDEPLDMTSILAGIYAGYMSGKFSIDAYAGGGFNQFEQNRRVRVGTFLGESNGEWDGTHLSGSLRAGYDVDFGKRYWARPVVSLDYVRLSEKSYTETGDVGVALNVDSRTSEMGAISGLLNFGAEFNGERTWIRPSIRFGYRNEFLSDPVLTSYSFNGITNAALAQTVSSDFPSSGFLVGFSIAAGSDFSSVGFDFDSDIRDGFIRHTGRIVVRLLF